MAYVGHHRIVIISICISCQVFLGDVASSLVKIIDQLVSNLSFIKQLSPLPLITGIGQGF